MSQDVKILCNYSLQEGFDSTGLERQGVGRMFPYHPDIYAVASDFYGPGSLLGWYLLIASFITTSVLGPIEITGSGDRQCRRRRPRVTTDLLAVILYAVFAATDLLVQAVGLVGLENRAFVIACLRASNIMQPSPRFDDSLPPVMDEMPPELIEYGQKMVAITGPLGVCSIFLTVITTGIFVLNHVWSSQRAHSTSVDVLLEPNVWVVRLVLGAAAYVVLCLLAFCISLDDYLSSWNLMTNESNWILSLLIMAGVSVAAVIFIGIVVWSVGSAAISHVGRALGVTTVYRQRPNVNDVLLLVQSVQFLTLPTSIGLLIIPNLVDFVPRVYITPLTDLGKPLVERGQLAALLVGAITTTFSVCEVLRYEGRARRARRMQADRANELSELSKSRMTSGEVTRRHSL
ncbi:hypothetical protein Micbo1qcDRAFT_226168 [Microdochium bolleyi]|uniref:Uncharacterized protein n=1 Tax=Microdochium bolleyi TaxID=196109 RepID=A0A136IIS4_9PEZI|nr:hypothetical protein Micbo1qcDRAFT_226168 [Microdochium bolleyi]